MFFDELAWVPFHYDGYNYPIMYNIHANSLQLSDFACFLHDKNRNRLIIQDKAKDSLYLKLAGDFDGSSAHELFNTLLAHGAGYYQVFIDTNELKTIHPFDIDISIKTE